MNDTWIALTRYKVLEDRVNELRSRAGLMYTPGDDVEEALREAEEELGKLKAWIEINFQARKID